MSPEHSDQSRGDDRREETGLEVEVWFRCPSTEELWRFAQILDDPADGGERVPPPPGRRNLSLTWTSEQVDPAAEPWGDAMLYGFGQAAHLVERATSVGIDVAVYAVRVQPLDAEFLPAVPATSGGDA